MQRGGPIFVRALGTAQPARSRVKARRASPPLPYAPGLRTRHERFAVAVCHDAATALLRPSDLRALPSSLGDENRCLRTNVSGPTRTAQAKHWSGRWDLNPRPSRWQRDALPLSYTRVRAGCIRQIGNAPDLMQQEGTHWQARASRRGTFSASLA
jgi:hypothetical protein